MDSHTFYWVVAVGIVLILIGIGMIILLLQSLIYSGDESVELIEARIMELREQVEQDHLDMCGISGDVRDIAIRTRAHFPSEDEQNDDAFRRRHGL